MFIFHRTEDEGGSKKETVTYRGKRRTQRKQFVTEFRFKLCYDLECPEAGKADLP